MYDYHVVLDFEMNPVDKTNKDAFFKLRQEIIEIGAVKLNKDFKIIDRFDIYVKPEYNRQVDPDITRLTGIHSAMTKDADTFEMSSLGAASCSVTASSVTSSGTSSSNQESRSSSMSLSSPARGPWAWAASFSTMARSEALGCTLPVSTRLSSRR